VVSCCRGDRTEAGYLVSTTAIGKQTSRKVVIEKPTIGFRALALVRLVVRDFSSNHEMLDAWSARRPGASRAPPVETSLSKVPIEYTESNRVLLNAACAGEVMVQMAYRKHDASDCSSHREPELGRETPHPFDQHDAQVDVEIV
jgi:hypothetical protein